MTGGLPLNILTAAQNGTLTFVAVVVLSSLVGRPINVHFMKNDRHIHICTPTNERYLNLFFLK